MPSKMFATQTDFSSRVIDTIVRYKEEFFYAMPHPSEAFHVSLFSLPKMTAQSKPVHVDDSDLNITAVKLGLFNYDGKVLEAIRIPTRRYRYGTPPEYISASYPEGGSYIGSCTGLFRSEGFLGMLKGQYPSVREALDIIRKSDGKHQVAVSRFFYLKEDSLGLIRLMFGDECVIWVGPDGGINYVEKTSINQYLTRCSKILSTITQELRDYAVRL